MGTDKSDMNQIFPCKCDSYVIEKRVFERFRGTDIPVTNDTSPVE